MMRSVAQLQTVTGNTVTIPTGHNFSRFGISGTVYSGVRYGSDGNVYARHAGGGWTKIGSWLVAGSAATFYISRTIDAGTLTTDAGAGPLQMNANRDYDVQRGAPGVKTATVSFEISDDISGSPIVAGPESYVFTAERESGA